MRSSVSGLRAAARSAGVSAANVVNMRGAGSAGFARIEPVEPVAGASAGTGSPDGDLYRPLSDHNVAAPGGGAGTLIGQVDPPFVVVFDPTGLQADADGLVARPNVDPVRALMLLGRARRAYAANLRPILAENERLGRLLNALS
jgi:hypothetical protein